MRQIGVVTAAIDSDQIAAIRLSGDFDLSNADRIDHAIAQAIDAGSRRFVVDLSCVSFADASALHALVRGSKRALRRNGVLVLVRPPAAVWRLFVLTGLSQAMRSFQTADAALEYLKDDSRPRGRAAA